MYREAGIRHLNGDAPAAAWKLSVRLTDLGRDSPRWGSLELQNPGEGSACADASVVGSFGTHWQHSIPASGEGLPFP